MYKIRYNVLAFSNALLGLAVSIMLIRLFGATNESDAFLIAVSIITAITMLQLLFVEQFLFFYNEEKHRDEESAKQFYYSATIVAIATGIISMIVVTIFSTIIVKIFAGNIDNIRFVKILAVLSILSIGLVVYPVNYVNEKLLNSENRISIPYIVETMPFMLMVLLMVYMEFNRNIASVEILSAARVLGMVLGLAIGIGAVCRIGFFPKLIDIRKMRTSTLVKKFVINSLYMRGAHNIHNFFVIPIVNNILGSLSEGYASYYYYAYRIVLAVKSVVLGPIYKIYQATIAAEWPKNDAHIIIEKTKQFFTNSVPLYIMSILVAYFMLPVVLKYIAGDSLEAHQLENIAYLFLLLGTWHLVITMEQSVVPILLASKKSITFYISNTIFIIIFYITTKILLEKYGVESIPISGAAAQIINLAIFLSVSVFYIKKMSRKRDA